MSRPKRVSEVDEAMAFIESKIAALVMAKEVLREARGIVPLPFEPDGLSGPAPKRTRTRKAAEPKGDGGL